VEDVEAVLCRLAGQAVHVDDDEQPPRGVDNVLRLIGREKEKP
jgi:hypothetical protein